MKPIPATTCRHCLKRYATRPRQLCTRCHDLQPIRKLYASSVKHVAEPVTEAAFQKIRRRAREPLPVKMELPCSECRKMVKLGREQAEVCARLRLTTTVCEACHELAVKGGA